MNETERIQKIMETQGADKQEARFIMGMADGDILDGVPLSEAPTLGDLVNQEAIEK